MINIYRSYVGCKVDVLPSACAARMFNRRRIIFLVTFAMAALGAAGAYAMGKVCLSSEIEGVVLDRGKPVEGAEVERAYEWLGGRSPIRTRP